jgi:type IV pilus assembly protein PilV
MGCSQNQGFSILEVILAVSVLTIGILSMEYLQTSSIRLNAQARGITEASILASSRMDHLMALAYYQIQTTAPTNENGYRVGWTVLDDPTNRIKRIAVTATWSSLGTFGETRQVTFESVKPYGGED